ncbi:type II toxin-antitoxin system RelE/ParE family toxin [Leucobacter sp. gxy201]|uniref:type II toxin-antitoxin system RelE/ParE family toxin n=1 Tax=Leucobacter sp. gxy201 TaxID=2957200 RepID=UPI003DA03AA5
MSTPTLNWTDQARLEYLSAVAWYAEHSSNDIADRFIDAMAEASHRIVDYPALGSDAYSKALPGAVLRFCKARDFPYLLFYIEIADESRIEVLRVLHERRDIPQHLAASSDE